MLVFVVVFLMFTAFSRLSNKFLDFFWLSLVFYFLVNLTISTWGRNMYLYIFFTKCFTHIDSLNHPANPPKKILFPFHREGNPSAEGINKGSTLTQVLESSTRMQSQSCQTPNKTFCFQKQKQNKNHF